MKHLYSAIKSGDTEALVVAQEELKRWLFKCRLKAERLWHKRMLAGGALQAEEVAQNDVYGAVIVTYSHCESSPGSSDECRSAPSGRRPSDQANRLGRWEAAIIAMTYIHHRYLLLLSPKADAHFTIPRRLEGTQHASPIQYYTWLHWVWETCPRFLHVSDLAGSRTSHLRYASPTLYQ